MKAAKLFTRSVFKYIPNKKIECGNFECVFQNKMTIGPSKTDGRIVIDPDIDWGFTCKYETDYTVEKQATITSDILNHDFASQNGQFSFDFKFYETESFEIVQENPIYKVGQQINFGREYFLFELTTFMLATDVDSQFFTLKSHQRYDSAINILKL